MADEGEGSVNATRTVKDFKVAETSKDRGWGLVGSAGTSSRNHTIVFGRRDYVPCNQFVVFRLNLEETEIPVYVKKTLTNKLYLKHYIINILVFKLIKGVKLYYHKKCIKRITP